MKLILSLACLVVYVSGIAAGNPFTIQGKLTGKIHGKYAYLQTMKFVAGQSVKLIRAEINNNQFTMSGQVDKVTGQVCSGRLFISDKPALTLTDLPVVFKEIKYDTREIILDELVRVDIGESVAASKVVGSTENEINSAYLAIVEFENLEHDKIEKQYKADVKLAGADKNLLEKLNGEKSQAHSIIKGEAAVKRLNTVKRYPASPLTLRWLRVLSDQNKYLAGKYQSDIEAVWDMIPASNKKPPYASFIIADIKAGKESMKLNPGAMIPDHSFTYKGGELDLKSLRGKYFLIDFWASWCGPCRAEHYEMKEAYKKFKGKNFEIIQVSVDNKEAAWRKALTEDQLPWFNLRNETGWDDKIKAVFNFSSIPSNYLVDPDGKIIARNLLGKELAQQLGKILE